MKSCIDLIRRAVAKLSDIHQNEPERILLAHSPGFQALLDEAEQRILQIDGLDHDGFWQAIGSKNRPNGT